MATTLFPDLFPEPVNDLSTAERNALVLSCEKLCRSLSRSAAVPGMDAEDMEQEALVVCVEAARRWGPRLGVKFSTYVTTAIRRHLANLVSAHKSAGTVHLESWDAVEAPGEREGDGDDFEFTAEQEYALSRLSAEARAVVRMTVAERLPPDRVAARIGKETKDVKLILRNAAKALRKDLADLDKPALFEVLADAAT